MAVRTLTYRDLTAEQRHRGAAKARERLLGFLNHPFLTPEQRASVYAKINMLSRWESLAMEVQPVVAALPAPRLPVAAPPAPALPAVVPAPRPLARR